MVFNRNHVNLSSLQEGEHLVYVARYHWFYMVMAFWKLIIGSWFLGWGVYEFLDDIIEKAVTEVAITTRRVIFKRGWLNLRIEQVNIERVLGCNVSQTPLGRIFNYGQVQVMGTGIDQIDLPRLIARPNDFRRALDESFDRHAVRIRTTQANDDT